MPDRSTLTSAERAVLYEVERQWCGCAFVSYAWLRMCTEPDARATRPDYPSNDRTLNRAVTQLERRGFIHRVRTQDRGTYHGLVETWDRLSEEIRSDVTLKARLARGSKADVTILVLGPPALPDDLRKMVWGEPVGPATPGVAFEFRGLKLGPGLHAVNVGPLPQRIPAAEHRVSGDVRLVEMVLTHPSKMEKR